MIRVLSLAAVGGGILWGIWVLLWRSTSFPVLLSGVWCPLTLGVLAWRWGLGRAVGANTWWRLDLWVAYAALFLLGVVRGTVVTGGAVVTGRSNPGIIAVHLRVKSDLSRLLLILAVTASPGTIALLAEGEILYVHCLRLPPGPSLPGVDLLQRVLGALAG